MPPPDADAAAHGARVAEHVARLVADHGGALPFSEYMDAVLYAPGLGYYSAGSHKLGEGGDFTTAPEISPLFGRCVAAQLADAGAGGGSVLEVGAGSGRLAADALIELARIGESPARYLILELSADLRARQRATLEALAPAMLSRVEWLDVLPVAFSGTVFANEVLDALPVERFRRTAAGVDELVVAQDGSRFAWAARPAGAELERAVSAIEDEAGRLPDGFESEVCLRLRAWLASFAAMLTEGTLLFIDYGMPRREYYSPARSGGTLRCHYRQRAHDDPFVWPGLQDITAQVDFTAVAAAGAEAGLDLAGYTTQAHFLIGCGLAGFIEEPLRDERARMLRSQQAAQLTMPDGMGERFKAIAFTRGTAAPLRGFSVRDLSGRL